MKRVLFYVCITLVGMLRVAEGAVLLDRVVAVVNDEIVTQRDLARFNQQDLGGPTSAYSDPDRLTQLIDKRLLLQEAQKRGMGITEVELERAVSDIEKRNNFQNRDALKAALSQDREGSWEGYLRALKEQLTILKLMSLTIEETATTEKEARDYYDTHRAAFSESDEVRLKQIFFPVSSEAPDAEVHRIHDRMLQAYAEAETGTDFDTLILKYRAGATGATGAADTAGAKGEVAPPQSDLGVFKRGDLAPEIDEAIFGLKTGGISPLVRSHLGFHLFKIIDQTQSDPKSFEESRSKIEEILLTQRHNAAYQVLLSGLRDRAFLEVK